MNTGNRIYRPGRSRAWGLAACIAISGCGGSGAPVPGSAGDMDGDEEDVLVATIESIQDHVFDPHCLSCHSGSSAPQGLRLENPGMSYNNLVDVASQEVPIYERVTPGNPDDSYLIHKLEGTQLVGGRMPLDTDPLPAEVIAVIRQWIEEGAAPPEPPEEESLFLPAIDL